MLKSKMKRAFSGASREIDSAPKDLISVRPKNGGTGPMVNDASSKPSGSKPLSPPPAPSTVLNGELQLERQLQVRR